GRFGEQRHELWVIGNARRVDPQRRRGVKRVQIQVALARPGIDDPGAAAVPQIQREMKAVGQHVSRQTPTNILVAGHRLSLAGPPTPPKPPTLPPLKASHLPPPPPPPHA